MEAENELREGLAFLANAVPSRALRPYVPCSFPLLQPDRAYLYDAALAAIVWARYDPERAGRALHTIREVAAAYRSALPFAIGLQDAHVDDRRSFSGTIAWAGYAACVYEMLAGDDQYRMFAMQLAAELVSRAHLRTDGFIPLERDHPAVSTEHNIDYYFFLRALEKLGVSTYTTQRTALAATMFAKLYDAGSGHFRRGLDDNADVLDCSSWGAIFALDVMGARSPQYASCIDHAFVRFWSDSPPGFMPDAFHRTVWAEGTFGMECALTLGRLAGAPGFSHREAAVAKAGDRLAVPTPIGIAVPYATTRLQNFPDSPATASTAWWLIAQLLRTGDQAFTRAFWAG